MYIKSVEIENIRSIEKFQMKFSKQPGWHVILGDNGAGKSTIIRSISLGLIGPSKGNQLREDWANWIKRGHEAAYIKMQISPEYKFDQMVSQASLQPAFAIPIYLGILLNGYSTERRDAKLVNASMEKTLYEDRNPNNYLWGDGKGWFSSAYGPFRRFTGGNQEYEKLHDSAPSLTAYLSAFGEGYALDQSLKWLQKLKFEQLEQKHNYLHDIKYFINNSGLLPHQTVLDEVNSEGIFFSDQNGVKLEVEQLSDGFRSILSLLFDLIRQLTRVYGKEMLGIELKQKSTQINLPGVVLIDEVDAHLHPTWQVRIGDWFTKFFPKIQFIVTTHSPLICRAAGNGSVWRLAAPSSSKRSEEITGTELQRLIYGNVLDAYGTEAFGQNVSRSNQAHKMLDELARLNKKSIKGIITDSERERLAELRNILPTESL